MYKHYWAIKIQPDRLLAPSYLFVYFTKCDLDELL